jgi:hypothetical protein
MCPASRLWRALLMISPCTLIIMHERALRSIIVSATRQDDITAVPVFVTKPER